MTPSKIQGVASAFLFLIFALHSFWDPEEFQPSRFATALGSCLLTAIPSVLHDHREVSVVDAVLFVFLWVQISRRTAFETRQRVILAIVVSIWGFSDAVESYYSDETDAGYFSLLTSAVGILLPLSASDRDAVTSLPVVTVFFSLLGIGSALNILKVSEDSVLWFRVARRSVLALVAIAAGFDTSEYSM